MTLPASLLTGVLTWDIGDLAADGAGGLTLEDLSGAAVTFVAAPAYLSDATSGKLVLPKPIGPVALSAGQQELALTDTDAVNPQAWTWTMLTTLPGGLVLAPITFAFPASALTAGQARLVDLAPVASSGGVLTTRGPIGPRGPAGIEPQGTWDVGTAYATDDAVYRNGSTYWAVQGSTGVDPETDTTSTYWHIMAEKGAPGDVSSVNSVQPDGAGNVTLAASDVGAVPATRQVNGHALSADVTLSASDVGADASGAASTAQAYAVQRAHHTGTQTLSTISDAGNAASKNVGTTSGTVAAGDDSRFAPAPALANAGKVVTVKADGSGYEVDTPSGAAAPTWTVATLNASLSSISSFEPVRYCKDAQGWVHVEGVFNASSSLPANSTLFTLPTGLRPASAVGVELITAGTTRIPISVAANGQVMNSNYTGGSGTTIPTTNPCALNFSFYVGP